MTTNAPKKSMKRATKEQKLYEQQFSSYQTEKMYDTEAVMQFGSAETKLKLLHIKLKEAEMAQAKMK